MIEYYTPIKIEVEDKSLAELFKKFIKAFEDFKEDMKKRDEKIKNGLNNLEVWIEEGNERMIRKLKDIRDTEYEVKLVKKRKRIIEEEEESEEEESN